jgi:hypothetical protein
MPVPRLFEAGADPREQWVHVLATLLQLGTPQTRAALVAELVGDPVDGTDTMLVSEQRAYPSAPGAPVVDIVLRGGTAWGVAIVADLAFDVARAEAVAGAYDALAATVGTATLVAITPDRRPPADLASIGGGRDVRHKSWLRVRDWVQERPERGAATGVDLALLREAEYFYTPRVADLYRLEELMPLARPELRAALSSVFFALADMAPSPTILNPSADSAVVNFPRTGEPTVTITLGDGDPSVAVAGGETLAISSPEAFTAGRSATLAAARAALPHRK